MTTLLSRRTFLQRAPIAAAAIATPVTIAIAEVRAEPAEDSDMKCMRLARELFNAMKAHYGDGCTMVRNEDYGSLLFAPPPRIVEFSGPGYYAVAMTRERSEVHWIERYPELDSKKMGRCFQLKARDTAGKRFWMFDDHLQSRLIEKIGGVA
jgi:hypothetical protein